MADMTLTDRLEAGERWDGDNAEVLMALGWENPERWYWTGPQGQHLWLKGEDGDHLPEPLDSVDAALALVPSGWFTDEATQNHKGDWFWCLHRNGLWKVSDAFGRGPTAAIALTAAILKAHGADHG